MHQLWDIPDMPNALRFKSVLLLFYSSTKCSILRPVHRKKTVVLVLGAGWLLPKLKLPSQRSLAQHIHGVTLLPQFG